MVTPYPSFPLTYTPLHSNPSLSKNLSPEKKSRSKAMVADNPDVVVQESHDFWTPKTTQFYINQRLRYSNDDLQFCSGQDPAGSGTCSPILWSPISTAAAGNESQSLSPNSRTLAIARGQLELMEMIKNLPESSYELSLKDLVQDLPGLSESREEYDRLTAVKTQEKENDIGRRKVVVKREESKKLLRTSSLDNNGMLLKMVFPISFRGTSRSKKAAIPRPDSKDNWWKKRSSSISSSHGSRSSGSGSGSGSDSNNSSRNNNERKMSSFLPYCCSSSFVMGMASERSPPK